MRAELIIYNGTIRTIDPLYPTAEAIAIANGRILAVGALEEIEATAHANTRRLDLGGRTLIPGFNDAHIHLWKIGRLLTTSLDLHTAPNIPALLDLLRTRAESAETWLTGHGYDDRLLSEHRHPTRHDLDKVSTTQPILLTHANDQIAAANSRALEIAGIGPNTADPAGGEITRDEHGKPTGVLHGTAVGLVSRVQPPLTDTEFESAVIAGAKSLLRLGITSVTEAGITPAQIAVYRRLTEERQMPFRVNAMALRYTPDGTKIPLPERFESNWLRVDTVKLFADGNLNSIGNLRETDERMTALIWDIHRGGLRAAIHAVSDVAIEQVISAIEYASTRLVSRMKHRIEHFSLPSDEHLRRCRGRINVVMQPVQIYSSGSALLRNLPDDLKRRLYPLGSILDTGLTVALSSDGLNANPLAGLKAAVDRLSADGAAIIPEQAISIEEALPSYTLGGAIVSGEDHLKGTISPGKYADLAVLSGDPLRAPVERLLDLRVEMTLVNGQIVFSA